MPPPSSETKRMHKLEMELLFNTVKDRLVCDLARGQFLKYQASLLQASMLLRNAAIQCASFLLLLSTTADVGADAKTSRITAS